MKSKPILKVLALFMIGMALGAMIMGWYVQRRLHHMHNHKGGKGFARHITNMSGAEGKEREQLYDLSLRYGEKVDELATSFHQDRVVLMDSLEAEATQILTGENKEAFLFHMGKMKNKPPHKMDKKK